MDSTFREIWQAAGRCPARRALVVMPENRQCLTAVRYARDRGLITPIFIAPRAPERGAMCHRVTTMHDAVNLAAELLTAGEADMVIQGTANRKQFLSYYAGSKGLGPQAVYATAFCDPRTKKTFFAIDPLVATTPSLENKLVQIDAITPLLKVLYRGTIRAAALAPIETVNPKIPATITAAVLTRMSQRKQFDRRLKVEGPLDIDCALSPVAARRKGIDSRYAGNYQLFILPDTNSAYFFTTFLKYIGGVPTIGVLLHENNHLVLNSGPLSATEQAAEIALGILAHEITG
jgi:phosphotransacetylase